MELELLFPLILVVYAKYTTEKAFDLMASHGISLDITTRILELDAPSPYKLLVVRELSIFH